MGLAGRFRTRTAAAVLGLTLASGLHLGAPPAVRAAPAESATALNDKGAAFFKRKQYVEASAAFERAYAIDPRDFRVLRYAGRCWQEIGDWERALTLLERYHKLETDEEARRTVLPSLEKLRAATPAEKADALVRATRDYPHARLEEAAARALEGLGGRANLLRAIEQLEVARLAATADADKRRIAGEIDRLRAAAARAPEVPATQTPAPLGKDPGGIAQAPSQATTLQAGPAVPSAGPTTTQWIAAGAGAAALVPGAALWVTAAAATETSNGDFKAGKIDYATYTDQRGAASMRYWGGIGLCAVGAGAGIAGWILGGRRGGDAAASRWLIVPERGGASLHVTY